MRHMPEVEDVSKAYGQVVDMIQKQKKTIGENTFKLIGEGTARGRQNFGAEKARRALEQLAVLDALEDFPESNEDKIKDARKAITFLDKELKAMSCELLQDFSDDDSQLPMLDVAMAMLD